jgi:hypothetical protein
LQHYYHPAAISAGKNRFDLAVRRNTAYLTFILSNGAGWGNITFNDATVEIHDIRREASGLPANVPRASAAVRRFKMPPSMIRGTQRDKL